jgi:hypothetical protein
MMEGHNSAANEKEPHMLAEGGEAMDEDSEIHGMLGEELMDALERKDKKAIMECIQACVMNCMNKE